MTDIARWLEGLGLGKYAEAFAAAEVDAAQLADLTDADLRELGLPLGPRKKLLQAIAAMGDAVPLERNTLTAGAAPGAERRQITVLFADLAGSTAMAQGADPEDFARILRGFQDAAAGAVTRFEGHVAKFMGDGLLAYFGWPRAHEDDAERAVRAALAMIEAVRGLKGSLQLRIGIATGLVVVGEILGEGAAREETAVGETLNLAARLQAEAMPGSILVAPSTRPLLAAVFDLEALEPRSLKGIADKVTPYRVVGERSSDSRFESARGQRLNALVGREQELALALARFELARTGEGQVVLLRAEPGIGKSRLVAELRARLEPLVAASLRYQCSPHHVSSALYPVIRQLGRAAGIVDDDDAEARSTKLAALAERSGIAAARAVPLLAALLSVAPTTAYPAPDMTPQQQKAATFALLVDLLAGLARDAPVLMVLEDLHWVDPTTRELFDLAVARIAELPVLLLVTFRPEIATPWDGRGHVTLLPLGRLGRRQVEALVVAVARGKALPAEVVEQIAAKADGVPLFVEELTKAVLEGGLLREAADRYELTGPLPALAVPSSLQASLIARLDRLSAARDVAQTGAALGREFEFELLAAVSTQSERQLGDALAELERAELLFARGAPPHTSWIFKHALIQDAAYGTLLRSARVTLHARIADTIRSRFPALAEREPETLARHCFEAGRLADAAELWEQAGDRAANRSAITESLAHYDRASACLRAIGDGETGHGAHIAEIGLKRAQVLLQVDGFSSAAVERTLVQAIEEADRADALDVALRARMARNICLFFTRLQFREALDQILHRLPSDEAALAPATRVHVLQHTATARFGLGDFAGAATEWTTSLALDDRAPVSWGGPGGALPCVIGRSYLSWVTAILGHLDDSVRHGRDAVDRARPVGHHFSTAWALLAHARGLSRIGDWHGSADAARAGLEITRRYGFLVREGNLRQYLGIALLHLGDVDKGATEIAEGVALWIRSAGPFHMTIWYADFALALLDTRHEALARDWIMRARSLHDGSQERVGSAKILRAEGLVSLRDGASDEAERLFRAALAVAASQQARLFELRAATDLARLLAERSRREEARLILAPLYAWFTQGFASPDLRRAKILLDEIGR